MMEEKLKVQSANWVKHKSNQPVYFIYPRGEIVSLQLLLVTMKVAKKTKYIREEVKYIKKKSVSCIMYWLTPFFWIRFLT